MSRMADYLVFINHYHFLRVQSYRLLSVFNFNFDNNTVIRFDFDEIYGFDENYFILI